MSAFNEEELNRGMYKPQGKLYKVNLNPMSSPKDKDPFQAIHDYILNNPSPINKMLTKMTPNKPTTLREEWEKYKKDIEGRPYAGDPVLDFWLSKFDSHNTELLQKIEEVTLDDSRKHDTSFNSGFNEAKRLVINLINQEK